MAVITRQDLFEAAWARPLTEIAEELAITSTGLKKICDRHDIPTPGRGYWAQVRAGKSFPRPKLRPVANPALEEVHIAGARPLPPAVVAAIAKARADAPPKPKPRRTPPPAATTSHPGSTDAPAAPQDTSGVGVDAPPLLPKALEPTRKAIARARLDPQGFATASGAGVVCLTASPPAQAAALAFLATFLEAAQARGWRLQPATGGAQLVVEGEPITFALEEQPVKTPHRRHRRPDPRPGTRRCRRQTSDRHPGSRATREDRACGPAGRT
jgi:hypothetical protein